MNLKSVLIAKSFLIISCLMLFTGIYAETVITEYVQRLGYATLYGLELSPDGTRFLTSSYDSAAYLWDLHSGAVIRIFSAGSKVNCFAFTSDGKNVLTGSGRTVKVWDISSGSMTRIFEDTESEWAISSIAVSPDGNKLLTGSFDTTAKLWDLKRESLCDV